MQWGSEEGKQRFHSVTGTQEGDLKEMMTSGLGGEGP